MPMDSVDSPFLRLSMPLKYTPSPVSEGTGSRKGIDARKSSIEPAGWATRPELANHW